MNSTARVVHKGGTHGTCNGSSLEASEDRHLLVSKRVPDERRGVIGKLEEKRSLNTRDPAEAKVHHLEMLSEIEARWRNLRAGPKTITEKEAHELAHPIHHQWLGTYRDNPREQTFWRTDLYEGLWAPPADWDSSVVSRNDF